MSLQESSDNNTTVNMNSTIITKIKIYPFNYTNYSLLILQFEFKSIQSFFIAEFVSIKYHDYLFFYCFFKKA